MYRTYSKKVTPETPIAELLAKAQASLEKAKASVSRLSKI